MGRTECVLLVLVVLATVRHDLLPGCRSESLALNVGGKGVGILCSTLAKLFGEFLEVSVLVTLDRHALSIARLGGVLVSRGRGWA